MDLELTKGVVLSEVIEYRHLFPEEKSLDIKNIRMNDKITTITNPTIVVALFIAPSLKPIIPPNMIIRIMIASTIFMFICLPPSLLYNNL